jgi:hypothetical protein
VGVAGVEAECDRPLGSLEHAGSTFDRPVAGEGPLVEVQRGRRRVGVRLVESGRPGYARFLPCS